MSAFHPKLPHQVRPIADIREPRVASDVRKVLTRLSVSSILAATLVGCSLEDFEVTPCMANGRLAFRIHEIGGWLRDYQPRPGMIIVHAYDPELVWSVQRNSLEERPARKVILYGQLFPGWEVWERPHKLRPGTKYHIYITDGGHSGNADFVADESLPDC